jgi:hypothetical protein
MNQAVDAKAASRLDSFIAAGNGSLTPIQRVDIYRESSTRARERALEVINPVCRQVVGSRCFAALAGGYVIGFPSMSADLNLYGADFPSHIEAQASAHAALAELTYLSDLARSSRPASD